MASDYWEDAFSVKPHRLRLTVSEGTKNVTNNTTVINWSLKVYKDPSGTPYGSDGTSSATINGGSAFTDTFSYNFGSYTVLTIDSGSKTVTHNSDGTKSINVSASAYMGSAAGSASITTKTFVLTPIARATTPEVTPSSGLTDSTFVIGHDAAASTFFHDVAYSIDGGATYTDLALNLAASDLSTDFTPPSSLFPNSTSGTARIRLITRSSSGGTIIGTKTVDVALTIPDTVKPSVSSVSWSDDQVSAPNMPSLMGGAGRFVQRWSKLKPVVTAGGTGGATIAASNVTIAGQSVASGVPLLPLNTSGAVPYAAQAIDSRGVNSDLYVNTVDVKAYNYPSLPTPGVGRTSDAAGAVPSPTGTYIAVTPAASVSSLLFSGSEKNLLEYQIRIKPNGGMFVTVQSWLAVAGTTWTTKRIFSGYLPSVEYTVEISVRDVFGKNGYDTTNTVKTANVIVPSEDVFMDWDGNAGLGFKKYRTNGVLDVGGDIYMNGYKVMDLSRLATNAETATGTATDKAVTPASLAALVASATARGIVELATDAEAIAGTDTARAITPANLLAMFVNERPVKVAFSGTTLVTIPCANFDEYELEWQTQISSSQLVIQIGTSGTRLTTALYDSNNVYAGGTNASPTSGGDMNEMATSWHVSPASSGTRDFLWGKATINGLNPSTLQASIIATVGSAITGGTSTTANSTAVAAVAGRHRSTNASQNEVYLVSNSGTATLTGYYVLKKIKYA